MAVWTACMRPPLTSTTTSRPRFFPRDTLSMSPSPSTHATRSSTTKLSCLRSTDSQPRASPSRVLGHRWRYLFFFSFYPPAVFILSYISCGKTILNWYFSMCMHIQAEDKVGSKGGSWFFLFTSYFHRQSIGLRFFPRNFSHCLKAKRYVWNMEG